jgi:hypothetical protein
MAHPRDEFYEDERILLETNPHWIAMWKEILYTAALLVVVIILLATTDLSGWVYAALLVAWAVACFEGVSTMVSTDLVVTNKRLVFRQGLWAKRGYEIPVGEIEGVTVEASRLQDMVGAGDLLIDRAGDHARTAIRDTPDPGRTRELIAGARRPTAVEPPHRGEPTPGPALDRSESGASRAEQLEILARLRERGVLSDEEFVAEKARVLKEG